MDKDEYFVASIPIDEKYVTYLRSLPSDARRPRLHVSVYYHRDATPRGIKVNIDRRIEHDSGFLTQLPDPRCGYFTALRLERKNARLGRVVAAVVEEKLDRIKEVALESDAPDWRPLVSEIIAEVADRTAEVRRAA